MKSISIRILNLVRSPQNEWTRIASDSPNVDSVGRKFFFPFLLFVTAVILLICVLELIREPQDAASFSQILRFVAIRFLVMLSSLFAGVYGSALILYELLKIRRFQVEENVFYKCFSLSVYSSSVMWVITLLSMMVKSLFFLKVVNLYVAYIIWCGLTVYYPSMKDNTKGLLSLVALVLMFVSPMMMGNIIKFLMS